MNEYLVIIPTYNEIGNISEIISKIRALKNLRTKILFVDDNSPDGTGKLIQKIHKNDKSIICISRKQKSGIGTAHITGIKWAYLHGYKKVITMDCDLTHDPKDIKKLIDKSDSADIVIASRYLVKNNMKGWSLLRKAMTKTSHAIVTLILKKDYDASNAYRLYNLEKIPSRIFNKIKSKNYFFFFESLYVILANGFSVIQIPTILHARLSGSSKMRVKDIIESLKSYSWFLLVDKTHNLKKKYMMTNDR